jgi:hypothetical protein
MPENKARKEEKRRKRKDRKQIQINETREKIKNWSEKTRDSSNT